MHLTKEELIARKRSELERKKAYWESVMSTANGDDALMAKSFVDDLQLDLVRLSTGESLIPPPGTIVALEGDRPYRDSPFWAGVVSDCEFYPTDFQSEYEVPIMGVFLDMRKFPSKFYVHTRDGLREWRLDEQ